MENTKYISSLGDNEHVLVLGGSGGIGSKVVRGFRAAGAVVSFTYNKNKSEAEALAEELRSEGSAFHYGSFDNTDKTATRQFLEEAVKIAGREITIAVNAVGWSPDKPFQEQTADLVRSVYDVNVVGPFITSRAIANRMVEKGVDGKIVLITSTNGINSHASFSAPYDLSKAAEIKLVEILAEEYAPSIRVNGVAPGWVNTKMNDTVPSDEMAREIERMWTRRMLAPEEVVSKIIFLSGSGGSGIYGQNIVVDGGYRR